MQFCHYAVSISQPAALPRLGNICHPHPPSSSLPQGLNFDDPARVVLTQLVPMKFTNSDSFAREPVFNYARPGEIDAEDLVELLKRIAELRRPSEQDVQQEA